MLLGGGCLVPFGNNLTTGVDCTLLPGVLDVSCVAGSCVVEHCMSGYTVAPNTHTHCVPSSRHIAEDILRNTLPLGL